MSRVFASPDIATLVANFSPVSISDSRPALVRSRSGNHLVSLNRTSARLNKILETCNVRIEKSKLATLLDVEDGVEKWLYENFSVPIQESRDRREILPAPVTRNIVDNLFTKACSSIINLDGYASEANIDSESLQQLIDRRSDDDLRRVFAEGTLFFCSDQVSEDMKSKLRHAIGAAGSDTCDLTEALSEEMHHAVLHELAKSVVFEMGGDIRIEGDHAIYIPANYSDAVNERLRRVRDERVKELIQKLDDQGYCIFDGDESILSSKEEEQSMNNLVLEEWVLQHPDVAVPETLLLSGDVKRDKNRHHAFALVMPDTLQRGIDDLKANVTTHAENLFNSGERSKLKSFTQSVHMHDFSMLQLDEFLLLICSGGRLEDVSSTLSTRLEQLEKEGNEQFVQLVEARLLVPLQLYTSGMDTIKEVTLKQHLEEFVTDHFRLEVVPQMLKAANEKSLLSDKEKERQFERLKQAVFEAKTFPILQETVSKFMKKLKIQNPPEGLVKSFKYRTLEASAKSTRQMKRGSDVLQNLIWILLAQKSVGLFMSSGKDTSRMIKQYEAVGDADLTKTLIQWKDKLKAGQESKEDLHAMRDMAMKAVEEIVSERQSSASASSAGI